MYLLRVVFKGPLNRSTLKMYIQATISAAPRPKLQAMLLSRTTPPPLLLLGGGGLEGTARGWKLQKSEPLLVAYT